jgi:hypothetical protein
MDNFDILFGFGKTWRWQTGVVHVCTIGYKKVDFVFSFCSNFVILYLFLLKPGCRFVHIMSYSVLDSSGLKIPHQGEIDIVVPLSKFVWTSQNFLATAVLRHFSTSL